MNTTTHSELITYEHLFINKQTKKYVDRTLLIHSVAKHLVKCITSLSDDICVETTFCVVLTAVPRLSVLALKCDSNFSLSVVDDDVDTAASAPSFALKLVLPDDHS